tara:strand:- start:235 stop:549 length:315 start_codon:yes stop_codon:yes gene_type:complete
MGICLPSSVSRTAGPALRFAFSAVDARGVEAAEDVKGVLVSPVVGDEEDVEVEEDEVEVEEEVEVGADGGAAGDTGSTSTNCGRFGEEGGGASPRTLRELPFRY